MAELEVRTAFTQEPMATLPMTSRDEAFALLTKAHELYLDRDRWLPKHERIAILERAAALIGERADELALQSAREGGKPLQDSLVEVNRAVSGIKEAIAQLHVEGGEEIPMGITPSSTGRMAYTFREPRGVVMAVSAFNHPFNLIIHQVIPAVAVGCPVIVKPAKATPLSCKALVDILHEAGLPADCAQMILPDNKVATELIGDPRTAFFTFIGSAKVGWMLRAELPPGAGCALEHGGVAPVIVDESADLDNAVPAITKGGFYHAGQVCVSVQRVFVHEDVAAQFTSRLVESAKQLKVGDPASRDTEVGPLIDPGEVDRVHTWVQEAVAGGAEVLCGGEKLSDTTYAATVVKNPPADAKLSRMEVFGPVVCVYTYSDLDDAIARANDVDAYFQAAVFTQRIDVALKCRKRLNGMAIMVNDHSAFRVDWMPFGGHRNSGLGAGGIKYSMHEMTLERLFVMRA
jgi:acyl-CoA reductase-like NAD-dependent aldehyde dehydrogenase